MFVTTVNYTDFDGHERKETLYFNITESQMRDLFATDPDFSVKSLNTVMESEDYAEMVRIMKKLMLASYGEKSEDGRIHKKNKEIRENFESSAAFEQLMEDVMYKEDVDFLKRFFRDVFPKKFSETIMSGVDNDSKVAEIAPTT